MPPEGEGGVIFTGKVNVAWAVSLWYPTEELHALWQRLQVVPCLEQHSDATTSCMTFEIASVKPCCLSCCLI